MPVLLTGVLALLFFGNFPFLPVFHKIPLYFAPIILHLFLFFFSYS